MSAEESVITITEDDTGNKAENVGDNDEHKYKVFDDPVENGPQKDVEETEIPLYEIPKENQKSKAFDEKVYVVAYNSVQPQRIQRKFHFVVTKYNLEPHHLTLSYSFTFCALFYPPG